MLHCLELSQQTCTGCLSWYQTFFFIKLQREYLYNIFDIKNSHQHIVFPLWKMSPCYLQISRNTHLDSQTVPWCEEYGVFHLDHPHRWSQTLVASECSEHSEESKEFEFFKTILFENVDNYRQILIRLMEYKLNKMNLCTNSLKYFFLWMVFKLIFWATFCHVFPTFSSITKEQIIVIFLFI